jgi:hypothetical protein
MIQLDMKTDQEYSYSLERDWGTPRPPITLKLVSGKSKDPSQLYSLSGYKMLCIADNRAGYCYGKFRQTYTF